MSMMITSDGVYRSSEPMTDDQLFKAAPSIFAAAPHESRSDQYCYIPTIDILRGLKKHTGLVPYGATCAKTRKADKKGYTKHLVRLRSPENFDRTEAPEIILINSHDGGSSYRLLAGVYRFACANGIIAGDGYEGARIEHKGDVLRDVIEATATVVSDFARIEGHLDHFKSLPISREAQEAYAEAAFQLRYDDAETAPATPADLLRARRAGDTGNDLWTVFNRVQEGVIRGGQARYVPTETNGRRTLRRKRARPVKGIDQNTALNRALWTLTERMADLAA